MMQQKPEGSIRFKELNLLYDISEKKR